MARKNHGLTHRRTTTVGLILLAHVVQSGCRCCCVVTCAFINRSYHNRCQKRNLALLLLSSSRLQLWQSRQPSVVAFWMQDKQLYAEAEVASSSVKAKCQLLQNRQYEDRSRCRILSQNIKRWQKKAPSHSPLKKSHDEPLRATAKPPRSTFQKKKKNDPLSSFGQWPGLRHEADAIALEDNLDMSQSRGREIPLETTTDQGWDHERLVLTRVYEKSFC